MAASNKRGNKIVRRKRYMNLVDLPEGKRTLDTKWVLKTKKAENGTLRRHKARLVVRGCAQKKSH